jgi:flagellum-specific peptidoglycan hydrolase FlgJ
MKEIPLYGGPSLQAAKANPGTAANAANGDQGQMLGASIHKAEQGLQGSAEAFSRISDFGEMQRQEVELRRIRDESDAEFSKLLSYAPGTKDSVFDKDGSIIKGRLDDLAYKFGQRIENLQGSFFNPENAIKARGMMESVKASLPERYWGLAAKHQLSVARQAFDTNLKLAEEKEDWGGYESSISNAEQSGTISPEKAKLLRVKGSKARYEKQQENLKTALFSSVAADPVHAASSVNKGLYNDLNPLDLDRAKREIRRRLADIATPAPLTAEDRRNIQEKNIDALKKQLPNGATEQMWKWARNAQKNGGRITEQDKVEIRGAFSMELDKLPVPKDRDEARQIATRIIQKWSKLGAYDGNEEYIRAVVMDKLDSRLDAAKGARRNDIGLVLRHIPDGAYIPNRSASVEDAYKKGDRKKIQEKEAARNLVESQIEEHVRVQMAYWRERNPEASIHDDRMQIFLLAAEKAKDLNEYDQQKNLSIVDKSREISRAFDSEAQVGDTREREPDSGQDFIDRKNKEWKDYQEKQVPYTPQVEVGKDSAPLAVPMSFVAGRRAGAYVPREMYQKLVQKYGSRPCLKATMDQSKAYNEVPVVGFYEGPNRGIELSGDEYGNRLIMLAGDKGNATVRFAPEEVPGMIEPGNIDLSARPVVRHADGSISTVRSISVEMDGKEYLIPTVSEDGKVLSEDDAVKQFKKTGKHLGVFDSPEDATAYARQLHEDQQSLYAPQQGAADVLNQPVSSPQKAAQVLSPALQQYESAFRRAGEKYGVDPDLLMAIAIHETGNGTSSAFRNKKNAMGVSPNGGGPRSFETVEAGIDYMARQLARNYLGQGLTTIDAIGRKYAPPGASNDPRGLNSHWVKGVSEYYFQLKA